MATFTFTAGLDRFTAGAANDVFVVPLESHIGLGDVALGGAGLDTLQFTGTIGLLVLHDRIAEIERVTLGGTAGIGVDASGSLGALVIVGNAAANAITGTALGDTITGGGGADTVSGGLGDDIFLVATAADMGRDEALDGGEGFDTLRYTATAGGTLVLGAGMSSLEAVVVGTTAGLTTGIAAINVDASLVGSALSITGNAGANVLTGTAGADTLAGGAGKDVFIVKAGAHHGLTEIIDGGTGVNVVRFTSTTASDLLVLSSQVEGIAEVELSDAAGLNTGTAATGIDASALSTGMLLTGNAGPNTLTGTQGADTITGGAGADELDGQDGNDIFLIGAAAEHAAGEAIEGGPGTDTIRYTTTTAGQTLALTADVTGIEAVVLASAAAVNVDASAVTDALNLSGNAAANRLTGGSGQNTFSGGGGADTLVGGGGSDLFLIGSLAEFPAAERIDGGGGSDTLRYTGTTAATLTLAAASLASIEAVEVASAAGSFAGAAAINVNAAALATAIALTGNAGANALTGGTGADAIQGGGGNDTLAGGAGTDTLAGQDGNDVFLIAAAADHGPGEAIDGGTGTDTIRFAATTAGQTLTLTAAVTGIENVALASANGLPTSAAVHVDASQVATALSIAGNAAGNPITGTAGGDTLTGGGGADTLAGGDGDDLFLIGAPAEFPAAERIDGGLGSDTLRYTGGAATLTLSAASLAAVEIVEIASAAGSFAGTAAVNVNASGLADPIEITGNAGANALTGTAGADTLRGGGGNDTLAGGAGADDLDGGDGNDVFVVAATAEHAPFEAIEGGAGIDTIRFAATTAGQTLAFTANVTGIESVALASATGIATTAATNLDASALAVAVSLAGNAGANRLTGGAGADTLAGGAGADTLDGGAGADALQGGLGNDILIYDASDRVTDGGAGIDTLVVSGSDVVLDITATANAVVRGIEVFDLTGSGNNTLVFASSDVATLGVSRIRIDGDAGDAVVAEGVWANRGAITVEGTTYREFAQGTATLQVQAGVSTIGIPVAPTASISLSALNGTNGFRLDGRSPASVSGFSVASAGDVNGDGFDDVIVGAPGSDYGRGTTYVVFGKGAAFSPSMELSALSGADGFALTTLRYDVSGFSVASAGDVNGDGFDDLIIGGPQSSTTLGVTRVVFGKGTGFPAEMDFATLDGLNGFEMIGSETGDYSGWSVASAGDFNGDGFGDLIVGAPGGPTGTGESYLILGKSAAFPASFRPGQFPVSSGFMTLSGPGARSYSGFSVASAGDVNGDGFCDLVVGAPGAAPRAAPDAGASYVVFGRAGPLDRELSLAALDGIRGFQLAGIDPQDYSGFAVSAAGDVNGDGFGDLIVGAYGADPGGRSAAGEAYVVFGRGNGFGASLDLSTLDGTNGFRLNGIDRQDNGGRAVASAGDVNGDGFDDLIVGAPGGDPVGRAGAGETYLVFGKAAGFGAVLELAALGGTAGIRLDGIRAGDEAGTSVAGAGDVNGDGFDDLIVGAPGGDPVGRTGAGESYVLFGRDFLNVAHHVGTDPDETLAGAGASEILIGGLGNDTLDGAGGSDVLRGGGGNDRITYDADDRRIEGGSGTDTLVVSSAGTALDLTAAAEARVSGFEIIDLTGSGDNTLTIDVAGLVEQTEGAHVLRVKGGPGDVVEGRGNWTLQGTTTIDGASYFRFTQGPATLLVQDRVEPLGTLLFPRAFDLNALDGSDGFRLDGIASLDRSGQSVASAGDVNGDGFDDLIVGVHGAASGGNALAGESYVVFGNASGFAGSMGFAALDGTNGFRVQGIDFFDYSGRSVASAGDVNGDGFGDLVIGAHLARPAGIRGAGESYVILGSDAGFAASQNLSALNGSNGFRLDGIAENDWSGRSVASAGDVNGDGFDDVLIGAPYADSGGNSTGESYIIFGSAAGFGAALALSSLDGQTGFRIVGSIGLPTVGSSVAAAGDINGDGYDDIVAGSAYGNASYVVFGKGTGFAASLNLSGLDGTDGFRLDGVDEFDFSGRSVASAGDVNGDGFGDLIVGAPSARGGAGESYVVFGRPAGFAAALDLASLDGVNGFRLDGAAVSSASGSAVASAGDVNGDGFDDVIVGAPGSNAAYLVFGRASGFAASIDLATMRPSMGFRVNGADLNGTSTASAGDVNGDGFDDLIVGAPGGDPGGRGDAGMSYVFFGRDFRNDVDQAGTNADEALTGTATGDILVAGLGNDTLDGAGGSDVVKGGGGSDSVAGGAGTDRLEGDSGKDALDGGADADRLYGGEGDDTLDGGPGSDILLGEGDRDIFLFDDALGAGNVDRVMDFGGAGATAMDAIHLENDVFTALLATGALAAGSFVSGAGPTAADADDFILYDTGTGDLFYDADGSNPGAAVKFATIATAPAALAASDFMVV